MLRGLMLDGERERAGGGNGVAMRERERTSENERARERERESKRERACMTQIALTKNLLRVSLVLRGVTGNTLPPSATHCNSMQHAATYCNTNTVDTDVTGGVFN